MIKWIKRLYNSDKICDFDNTKICSAKSLTIERAGIICTTSENVLGCCKFRDNDYRYIKLESIK